MVRLKQFASSVGKAPDSAVVFRTLRANQETHVSQLRLPVMLLVAWRERWGTHNSCRRVNRPISVGMVPTTSGPPATTMRVRTLRKLPISVGIDPVISFDSSEPPSLWNRSTRERRKAKGHKFKRRDGINKQASSRINHTGPRLLLTSRNLHQRRHRSDSRPIPKSSPNLRHPPRLECVRWWWNWWWHWSWR